VNKITQTGAAITNSFQGTVQAGTVNVLSGGALNNALGTTTLGTMTATQIGAPQINGGTGLFVQLYSTNASGTSIRNTLDDGTGNMILTSSGSTPFVATSTGTATTNTSLLSPNLALNNQVSHVFGTNTSTLYNAGQVGFNYVGPGASGSTGNSAFLGVYGNNALKVYGNGKVSTPSNVLDDGSGKMTVNGVLTPAGGLSFTNYTVNANGNWGLNTNQGWTLYNSLSVPLLSVSDSGQVNTKYNILDDGSGRMTLGLTGAGSSFADFNVIKPALGQGQYATVNIGQSYGTTNGAGQLSYLYNSNATGSSFKMGLVSGANAIYVNGQGQVGTNYNSLDGGTGQMTTAGLLTANGGISTSIVSINSTNNNGSSSTPLPVLYSALPVNSSTYVQVGKALGQYQAAALGFNYNSSTTGANNTATLSVNGGPALFVNGAGRVFTNNSTLDDGGGNMYVGGTDLKLGVNNTTGRGAGGYLAVQDANNTLKINYVNSFSGGTVIGGPKVSTTSNTLDDGSGNMTISGNATPLAVSYTGSSNNYALATFLAPSVSVSGGVGLQVGRVAGNTANFNSALLSFSSTGANSTANLAQLSSYGGPGLTVNGVGAVKTPLNTLDDSYGNLSATGAIAAHGAQTTNFSTTTAQIGVYNGGNGPAPVGSTAFVQGLTANAAAALPLQLNPQGGKLYSNYTTLDDGNGNLTAITLSTTGPNQGGFLGKFLSPNLTVGATDYVVLGQSLNTNSSAVWQYSSLSATTGAQVGNRVFNQPVSALSAYGGSPGLVMTMQNTPALYSANSTLDDGNGNLTYGTSIISPASSGVKLDGNGNVVFKSTALSSNGWQVLTTANSPSLLVYNNTTAGGSKVQTYSNILDDGVGNMTVASNLTLNSNFGLQQTQLTASDPDNTASAANLANLTDANPNTQYAPTTNAFNGTANRINIAVNSQAYITRLTIAYPGNTNNTPTTINVYNGTATVGSLLGTMTCGSTNGGVQYGYLTLTTPVQTGTIGLLLPAKTVSGTTYPTFINEVYISTAGSLTVGGPSTFNSYLNVNGQLSVNSNVLVAGGNQLSIGGNDSNAGLFIQRYVGTGPPISQAMTMNTNSISGIGACPLVYQYGYNGSNSVFQSAFIVTDNLAATGCYYGQSQNFARIYSDGAMAANGPLCLGTTSVGSNQGVSGLTVPIMTKVYGSATAARSITLPDLTGTVALTSQLPLNSFAAISFSVSSNGTNSTSILTGTSDIGCSGYTVTFASSGTYILTGSLICSAVPANAQWTCQTSGPGGVSSLPTYHYTLNQSSSVVAMSSDLHFVITSTVASGYVNIVNNQNNISGSLYIRRIV